MAQTYEIRVAPLTNRLERTVGLWRAHWDEQGEEAARGLTFNPDVRGFIEAEARGWFAYIGVFLGDDLIGHFGLAFHRNRQTSRYVAGDEFFYLAPEHRKGLLAVRLIRFARDMAFERGAVEFGLSFRTFGSIELEPLMRRLKMRHIANVYSLRSPRAGG